MVEGAEENAEQLPQVHVVWCLVKAQPPTVVEVHGKLCRESLAGGGGGVGGGGEKHRQDLMGQTLAQHGSVTM